MILAGSTREISILENALAGIEIERDEFHERIQALASRFGRKYVEALATRAPVKPQDARVICRDAKVLSRVVSLAGLSAVCRNMMSQTDGWVHDAIGEWFQLEVAGLCAALNPAPELECKLDGVPKDVVLDDGKAQIECKAFLLPYVIQRVAEGHVGLFNAVAGSGATGTFEIEVKADLVKVGAEALIDAVSTAHTSGHVFENALVKVEDKSSTSGHLVEQKSIPGVTIDYMQVATQWHLPGHVYVPGCLIGNASGLSLAFTGPPVHLLRNAQNAIEDKLHQMNQGVCNLIALDLSNWYGDLPQLADELKQWLEERPFDRVTAALLCRGTGDVVEAKLDVSAVVNTRAKERLTPSAEALVSTVS